LTVSRSSFHVRGRIITAITKEPTASARTHPVSQITAAATRTATEPSASFDDLDEGGAGIQVPALDPGPQQDRHGVPEQPDDAEDDHHPPRPPRGFEQAADALDQDEAADREQDRGLPPPPPAPPPGDTPRWGLGGANHRTLGTYASTADRTGG
jgi:hypothetical protein